MDPLRALDTWLNSSPSREHGAGYADWRLEPLQQVLALLPAPPAPITIAGTKGKGSTLRFLEQLLLAEGCRTLAFTSPHLRRVSERWRLDGNCIDPAALLPLIPQIEAAERASGVALTYFERCFCLAVLLGAARPDRIFLCEVGLGGRLDCANALDARLVILTHLGHDHRDVLGPDLAAIAREKLAVARRNAPLLIAAQSPAAEAAIRAQLPAGQSAQWLAPLGPELTLGLPGEHQRANAACALAAAAQILGRPLDQERAAAALAGTRLAGRCQLVQQAGRRLLIDGAHHGPSIRATLATAQGCLAPGWQLVLGLARDKELAEILAEIPQGLPVTRCGYRGPRALRSHEWPAAAQGWPYHDKLASALAALPADCDLCISGSFYLAGECLELLALPPEAG